MRHENSYKPHTQRLQYATIDHTGIVNGREQRGHQRGRPDMRILITGGAGFIGHNLAQLALASGHSVAIVDDMSTGYADNLDDLEVDLTNASILDKEALVQCMAGVDSVIHLAALGSVPRSIADPVRSFEVNATGTLTVLEAARAAGVDHVVYSSSSSVYGLNPALPKHEREWVRPMSPYAVSKLTAEQFTLAYQESFGLKTLAFRFFNVFGPGQRAGHAYAAVIPTFLEAMYAGRPVWVNGDGSNSRDFTYVGTVIRVLLQAAERRVSHPEPVNLAFGTNTNILQLIREIENASGLNADVRHRESRPGDVPHSQADNTTLRSLFPDISPRELRTGLDETVAWTIKNALVNGPAE